MSLVPAAAASRCLVLHSTAGQRAVCVQTSLFLAHVCCGRVGTQKGVAIPGDAAAHAPEVFRRLCELIVGHVPARVFQQGQREACKTGDLRRVLRAMHVRTQTTGLQQQAGAKA